MKYNNALILNEEAKDDLCHITTLENLSKILSSGYIKGGHYGDQKDEKGNIVSSYGTSLLKNDDSRELCLGRKNNVKLQHGSTGSTSQEVFIYLDMDSVKNLKGAGKGARPTYEHGLASSRHLEEQIKYYLDPAKVKDQAWKKGISEDKIYKQLADSLRIKDTPEHFYNKYYWYLKDEFKSSPKCYDLEKYYEQSLATMTNKKGAAEYSGFGANLRGSEGVDGESRIDLSKSNIPVSSKYIRIVINPFVMKQPSYYFDQSDVGMQIIKYYEKDPKLFVGDVSVQGRNNEAVSKRQDTIQKIISYTESNTKMYNNPKEYADKIRSNAREAKENEKRDLDKKIAQIEAGKKRRKQELKAKKEENLAKQQEIQDAARDRAYKKNHPVKHLLHKVIGNDRDDPMWKEKKSIQTESLFNY